MKGRNRLYCSIQSACAAAGGKLGAVQSMPFSTRLAAEKEMVRMGIRKISVKAQQGEPHIEAVFQVNARHWLQQAVLAQEQS